MKHVIQLTPNRTLSMRQGGFIMGPILVGIALIAIVIGFMAFANRGPATSTNNQQNSVNASLLIKQGSDLAEGYARAIGDGVTPSSITLDTTTGTGLFDPTKGFATAQTVPTKACSTTTTGYCTWALNRGMIVTGVGTGSADAVVLVAGLSIGTCESINKTLWNDATPGTGAGVPTTAATFTQMTTVAGAGDLALTAGTGRNDGCVKNAGGDYVYYKVVNAV